MCSSRECTFDIIHQRHRELSEHLSRDVDDVKAIGTVAAKRGRCIQQRIQGRHEQRYVVRRDRL